MQDLSHQLVCSTLIKGGPKRDPHVGKSLSTDDFGYAEP